MTRRKRAYRINGWSLTVCLIGLVAMGAAVAGWMATRYERLVHQARRTGESGDWAASAMLWRRINRTYTPTADSFRDEARAALAAGRAAQAATALRRSLELEPAQADPWLLLLELLRLEDQPLEASLVGWRAYLAVGPQDRAAILRNLTLALLADTPEDLARATLASWVASDPNDLDAQVALLRRQAASPRDGDPTRAERIARLTGLLEAHPTHLGLREALIVDLADAGEPGPGRILLDGWPEQERDARYFRLQGRWLQDYEARPADAVEAFRQALVALPHDWRTRYRLSRALKASGFHEEAQAEALKVATLREAMDPTTLGPRLDRDLEHITTSEARIDLANLCRRLGLTRLGEAWDQIGRASPR